MTIGTSAYVLFSYDPPHRLVVTVAKMRVLSHDGEGAGVLEEKGTYQRVHIVPAARVFPTPGQAAEAAVEECRRLGRPEWWDAVREKMQLVGE